MQGSKLYVGNFTYSTTEDQLRELFSQHGEVKEVNVIGSKGFGGRTLRVDEARPRKERSDRPDRGYRRY